MKIWVNLYRLWYIMYYTKQHIHKSISKCAANFPSKLNLNQSYPSPNPTERSTFRTGGPRQSGRWVHLGLFPPFLPAARRVRCDTGVMGSARRFLRAQLASGLRPWSPPVSPDQINQFGCNCSAGRAGSGLGGRLLLFSQDR